MNFINLQSSVFEIYKSLLACSRAPGDVLEFHKVQRAARLYARQHFQSGTVNPPLARRARIRALGSLDPRGLLIRSLRAHCRGDTARPEDPAPSKSRRRVSQTFLRTRAAQELARAALILATRTPRPPRATERRSSLAATRSGESLRPPRGKCASVPSEISYNYFLFDLMCRGAYS